jgi:hypothetical protein
MTAFQCSNGQQAGSLSVTGKGTVMVTSDAATVRLSVQVTDVLATVAREEAARTANAVVSAVQSVNGVGANNVTSTGISLQPQYDYDSTTGRSNITGYQFTNSITVEISSVTGDLVSNVTDAAVQAGGNNVTVDSISFDLSPALRLQSLNQARTQAVDDARAAARLFAQTLGVQLARIASFSESAPNIAVPIPLNQASEARAFAAAPNAAAASTPTPVQVGQQEVSTSVSVEYDVCPTTGLQL